MKILIVIFCVVLSLAASAREFTGRNGKKIEAEVVSKTADKVKLKLDSGKEVDVPLSSLSETDQLFVATWESPEAKEARLKAVELDEALSAKGYVPLTLSIEKGGLMVQMTIDGQEFKLLVNHQNEKPVLKKSSADDKGLKVKAVEGGGNVSGTYTAESVGNGDEGVKGVNFLVAELKGVPDGIDGVIGGQVFVDHSVQIDFGNMKLWLK